MKKKPSTFQRGNVILLSVSHLIHDIYGSFLAPILPLLIEKLGMNYTMAGMLSLFQRFPSFIAPFVGLLADRIQLRYLVILCPAITAVAMSLIGLAPSYYILATLLLIAGISSALYHVPSPVMVRKVSGEATGQGMSFYMLGGELARTLGPLTILGAVTLWELVGTWKLIPFGLTASALLWWRLHHVRVREDIIKKEAPSHPWKALRKLVPFFATITGYMFFRALLKSSMSTFLPTLLTGEGGTLWSAGLSLAIFQLAGAAGTLITGTASDKIGRKKALLIMAIATPLMMFAFLNTTGVLNILALIGTGLLIFGSTPVLLAMVQETNTSHASFINGVYMTLNFAMSSTAVFLAGWMADIMGLNQMFNLATALSLISLIFIIFIPNTPKTKIPAPKTETQDEKA
ncbi:MAG: MFS transporter [Bacteroidales bacterium]|nr:MFS transporter [Bacteroidales bacterium]